MGRIFKITDGTTEVDLLNTGSDGIIPDQGGLGPNRIAPRHNFTEPGAADGGGVANVNFPLITDAWKLNVRGADDDAIAGNLRDLIYLLRRAWRYHTEPRQNVPVYIQSQTTGETNARHSLVYGAPEMVSPDFFAPPFEVADLLENFIVQIVRESFWRSVAPGSLGTALTLSPKWDGKVIERADFDTINESGSSTIEDVNGDIKWTIDSSQNPVSGLITAGIGDETRSVLGFRFDPDVITMATGNIFVIALARADSAVGGTTRNWILDLIKRTDGYKLRPAIYDDGGTPNYGAEIDIINGEVNVLVEWSTSSGVGADDGHMETWIEGVLEDSIVDIDCDLRFDDYYTVGAITGIDAGTEGSFRLSSIYWATERDGIPDQVHIANHRDEVLITHFRQDDGGSFSDLGPGDTLFPAVPAQDDAIVWSSTDQPLKTIVLPKLKTAAVFTTTTLVMEYSTAAGFSALTRPDEYTTFPSFGASGSGLNINFAQTEKDILINIKIPSDHAKYTYGTVNAFHIRLREDNASPSWGTIPVANDWNQTYHQNEPSIEIPPGIIKGDVSPYLMYRIMSPHGGDDTPTFASTSRILVGSKSRGLDKFVSHLNGGGDDNPGDWATTQVTDATSTTDPQAPGGKHSAVSFAGDSTMQPRVRFTGTDILESWVGEYRAFIRIQQIGGASGDTSAILRTFSGGSADDDPHVDTAEVDLVAFDDGIEVLDLGVVRIPFARPRAADELSGVDVVFEIHAERSTGAGTLRIYDLILIPIDEWVVGLDDPLSDIGLGSSALRGSCALDVDGGVIAHRTAKVQSIGGSWILSENWARMGKAPSIPDVGLKTRLYFLILHYEDVDASGDWGQAPLFADLGAQLDFQIFGHMNYLFLRGDD